MITPESIKDELGAVDGGDIAEIVDEVYAMYRTGDPEQIAEADELLWQCEEGELPFCVCSSVIHLIRKRCSQAFSFSNASVLFQAEMSFGEGIDDVDARSIDFQANVRLGDSRKFREPKISQ